MGIIEKAREVAGRAHQGQVRKTDGSPYIDHPLAVAEILKTHGFADEVIAAALVHDVLEDTPVTEAELRAELGGSVTAIVTAVSEEKALEWRERKHKYIEAVTAAPESVKAVSVADKIHNAASLIAFHNVTGPAAWEKFNRGKEDKLWFERTLLESLKRTWQHPLLTEYEQQVKRLETLD